MPPYIVEVQGQPLGCFAFLSLNGSSHPYVFFFFLEAAPRHVPPNTLGENTLTIAPELK